MTNRTFLVCSFLWSIAIAMSGCSRIMGDRPGGDPVPNYPDGAAGLQAMFTDVLAAARADDRARVHDLFAPLKMTRAQLDKLFGARAEELAHAYDEMMGSLINRGAVELVGMVYEKKYDAVEVIPFEVPSADAGVAASSSVRPEDGALARALQTRPALYSVRLKKTGQALGTRYDFFFFDEGHWRTGNLLGKVLAKHEAELTAAPHAR